MILGRIIELGMVEYHIHVQEWQHLLSQTWMTTDFSGACFHILVCICDINYKKVLYVFLIPP